MSEKVAPYQKTLLLIPGISACGKTTLAHHLSQVFNEQYLPTRLVVPYTTRSPRFNEREGVDYHFVSQQEFQTNYQPEINRSPGDWDVDTIGSSTYFNRIDETTPIDKYPLAVLPVAIKLMHQMKSKYNPLVERVIMLPLVVSQKHYEEWFNNAKEMRKGRDLRSEYAYQQFLMASGMNNGLFFELAWILEADKMNFASFTGALLGLI